MEIKNVDSGYYLTLDREPYTNRQQTFEKHFEKFYGFDKNNSNQNCHLWQLGKKCTNKLNFVYANSYSHYLLYKQLSIKEWSSNFIFILEDDAVFHGGWLEKWNKAVKHIPDDADFVYLHHHPSHIRRFTTHFKKPLNDFVGIPIGPYSTTSYAVTKKFVLQIVKHLEDKGIYRSLDSILNDNRSLYKVYTLIDSLCFENREDYKSERLTDT